MNANNLTLLLAEKLHFLVEGHNYFFKENEHQQNEVHVLLSNGKFGITISYDQRESCFNDRLLSSYDNKQAHLYLAGEIRQC